MCLNLPVPRKTENFQWFKNVFFFLPKERLPSTSGAPIGQPMDVIIHESWILGVLGNRCPTAEAYWGSSATTSWYPDIGEEGRLFRIPLMQNCVSREARGAWPHSNHWSKIIQVVAVGSCAPPWLPECHHNIVALSVIYMPHNITEECKGKKSPIILDTRIPPACHHYRPLDLKYHFSKHRIGIIHSGLRQGASCHKALQLQPTHSPHLGTAVAVSVQVLSPTQGN